MENIFKTALGLSEPWYIKSIEFNEHSKRLDIYTDFRRGSKFLDEETGETYPVFDTQQKEWKHLNFF